jgi:hypothetical protein
MRRGETAVVFDHCRDMRQVYQDFLHYLDILSHKCNNQVETEDPSLKVGSCHEAEIWRNWVKNVSAGCWGPVQKCTFTALR